MSLINKLNGYLPSFIKLLTAQLLLVAFWVPANYSVTLFKLFTPTFYQKYQAAYGSRGVELLEKWKLLIEENQNESDWQKLHLVNNFFNREIKFIDDIKHWGVKDYWATPIEMLGSHGGDCEDYSIAKYFTLRALGVQSSKLRLMYVRALEINQAHMVLIYSEEPTEVPLVLDNIKKKILPAHKRKDLKPIYSFNGDGLWLARSRGLGKKIKGKGSMALWEDVVSRIENGQFKTAK